MLKQRSAEIVSSGSFLRVVNSAMPRSSMPLEDRALEHVFDYLKMSMHVRPAYGIALRGVSLLVRFDLSDSTSDIRDSLVFSLRGAAWVTLLDRVERICGGRSRVSTRKSTLPVKSLKLSDV